MNPKAEPPEKKKRKKIAKTQTPSFSLLPDEIIENCLARVPRSYYPELSLVSKSFRSILSSTDIYAARSRLGTTQKYLYVCLQGRDSSYNSYFHWITLSINPNRTKTKKKKNKIRQLSVLIAYSNLASVARPTVVGYEIYVIGGYNTPSSAVRFLDCRKNTWHDAPSMNVPRENPVSCAYNGKIYVIGGTSGLLEDEFWGEVFDIKTQTWERFPRPGFEMRNSNYYKIIELEGKIYFGSGCGCKMYACYDPKQCKWDCKVAMLLWPQCVMVDTISYSIREHGGRYNLWWNDINGIDSKEVKGLDTLVKRYERHGDAGLDTLVKRYERHGDGSYISTKVTSCGGKLYVMWEGYMKICCAEISVKKRDGDDIWGNVQWLDFPHKALKHCHPLHCLAISL